MTVHPGVSNTALFENIAAYYQLFSPKFCFGKHRLQQH